MRNMKLFAAIMMVASVFFACNQTAEKSEGKFVLNGTITGMTEGKFMVTKYDNGKIKRDSFIVKDGKFTFTGDYPVPKQLFLTSDKGGDIIIYAENTTMTLTADASKLNEAVITGGTFRDEVNKYKEGWKEATKAYNQDDIFKVLSDSKADKKATAKAEADHSALNKAKNDYQTNWIKNNPKLRYTAHLIQRKADGASVEQLENLLAMLDASLADYPIVVELNKKLETMKNKEVSFDKFIPNASNVTYKLDKSFNGKNLKGIKYLGAFKNNNICAFKVDGTIQIIGSYGKVISSFKTNLKSKPASVAVDNNDNIYLLSAIGEEIISKIRGKEHKKYVTKAIECTVFNKKGQKQNNFQLEGLKSATGAKVLDNKLMVSDAKNSIIGIFDPKTGEQASKITGMRPCCGILDFSVSNKKEIIVANLGAFRVQSFDLTGKSIVAFGGRGTGVNEFQGCCNPMSVAYLSNGAIVTAEKDPTRVKIFSKEGARQIEGVDELVKGCSYIPMIVDNNDNLYLASDKKGMVKCVSAN